MKRFLFFIIVVFLVLNLKAQDITDGLRYSIDDLSGTARFTALSGAFGALGGDLTAMTINPAGSAIFLNNFSSATFSVSNIKNDANYFNTSRGSSETDINVDQAGVVFVFVNSNIESAWKKFSIGINYNTVKNYDNELLINGVGNKSIGNFFTTQAQGIPLELLQLRNGESISDLYSYLGENQGTNAQNAFLGYQGYVFDPLIPDDPTNNKYISNIAPGIFNQEYYLISKGFKGKYTINFATQITDRFYLGINFNTYSLDYDQGTYLFETNSNQGSRVNKIGFENNLYVYGNGFSTQIGGIVKVTESFRVGLTYDSPTWFNIYEETYQTLETQRTLDEQVINEFIDPMVINVYEKYDLRAPGKVAASVAHIFGKQGLLSFDYSYQDYSTIKFSPSYDPHFITVNQNIKDNLTASSSYRLGAEYRIKNFKLRGGYMFEESPYKDKNIQDDLSGFSFGTGVHLGNYSIDFSFSRTQQERNHQLYSIGLTDKALIETYRNNYILSINYNL
jgi:hypothetical protein